MNNVYSKLEGTDEYVKDLASGSILSTNKKALAAYKQQRAFAETNQKLEATVIVLTRELAEIKELINKLSGIDKCQK